MKKNIVFCADGTWNGPGEDLEGQPVKADPTNVLKIYHWLAGKDTLESTTYAGEAERKLYDKDGNLVQIAKYLDGVGYNDNWLVKLLGGVFGAGLIARIVRGYTFISRNYQPGDDITIIGFSRGAYTARALAGLIIDQGLMDASKCNLEDKEFAYRVGCSVWNDHQQALKAPQYTHLLTHIDMLISDLPGFFTRAPQHPPLIKNVPIKAVAVWDTVGALGIPDYKGKDVRLDAFRFSDAVLSSRVEMGLHAISLDEERVDFTPTLWDPAKNVTQRLFYGAHADVGGGYPLGHPDSSLSDMALIWMQEQLTHLQFEQRPTDLFPDIEGTRHKPWTSPPYSVLIGVRLAKRDFSTRPDIVLHV